MYTTETAKWDIRMTTKAQDSTAENKSEFSNAIISVAFIKNRVGGKWVTYALLNIWYETGSLAGKWDPCVWFSINTV